MRSKNWIVKEQTVIGDERVSKLKVQSNIASTPLATLALLNVIEWANKVVDDLHTMTWKKVGNKTCPDSTVDYSAPVYDTIPNPNKAITNILST
jgi:hypothetical protein